MHHDARPRPSYKPMAMLAQRKLRNATMLLARRITCDWCGAGPEEPCVAPDGYQRYELHSRRIKAAQAMIEP